MWQFSALLFLFLPGGSSAQDPVTGPAEVRGQEQGSLTVQCRYNSGWKDYQKYWCQGAYWKSCEILVETDASEQMVKKNRVSIKDDQTHFIFTVTMEDLRMSDAGIYWCGITRTGNDHMFEVNVNIDPALETSTTVMTTTVTVPTYTSPTTKYTGMGNTGREHVTQSSPLIWFLLSSISFQLLSFVMFPLLLTMFIAVLWINRPQRHYGGDEIGLVKIHSSDAQDREKHFPGDGK